MSHATVDSHDGLASHCKKLMYGIQNRYQLIASFCLVRYSARNKKIFESSWPRILVCGTSAICSNAYYSVFIKKNNNFFFQISVLALIVGSGFGITAGAHRLWSHKAYKAKWQLRLLLTFLFTISGQVSNYLKCLLYVYKTSYRHRCVTLDSLTSLAQ